MSQTKQDSNFQTSLLGMKVIVKQGDHLEEEAYIVGVDQWEFRSDPMTRRRDTRVLLVFPDGLLSWWNLDHVRAHPLTIHVLEEDLAKRLVHCIIKNDPV